MSQTTAQTFITATLLLVLSMTLYLYGHHVVESQIAEVDGMVPMYHYYDMQLEMWEKAAGWVGLVAFSVFIGGMIFWEREKQPIAEPASILRLNERAPGQMVEVAAPLPVALITAVHLDESNVRRQVVESSSEDEYLTPLERVIRGY